MKSSLSFIPFIAFLLLAICVAIASSYTDYAWMNYVGIGLFVAIIAAWAYFDKSGFKFFFSKKGTGRSASATLNTVLVLVVFGGIAHLSTRPTFNKSLDLTEEKLNSLTQPSIDALKAVEEKDLRIEVIGVFTMNDQRGAFADKLSLYQRHADIFDIRYLDAETDRAEAIALEISSDNTAIFKIRENETRITQFSEEKITNAILNLMKTEKKTIYFTVGHGEPALDSQDAGNSFAIIKKELEGAKIEAKPLQLMSATEIPQDASAVVIAGPQYDFEQPEVELVQKFLDRGGDIFVMLGALAPLKNLRELLKNFGLGLADDFLILPPNLASAYGQTTAIISKLNKDHAVTSKLASGSGTFFLFPNARSIEKIAPTSDDLGVEILAETTAPILAIDGVKTPADMQQQISQDKVKEGDFTVMATVSKKADSSNAEQNAADAADQNETRIILVSSSQFAIDAITARQQANTDLFMGGVNYLLGVDNLISIKPKEQRKGSLDLNTQSSQLMLLLICFVYPFMFLGLGIVHWFRRRNA